MIKLAKTAEPAVLIKNAATWTTAIAVRIAAGEKLTKTERSRYNHEDIKRALIAETHGKCAYCESKLRHVTYGDIEHIAPKVDKAERWFDWTNLTLACDVCNTLKSDFEGDSGTFLDPYDVDPEEHFWLMGAAIYAQPGSSGAAATERLLELNRTELVERRTEKLLSLLRHLDVIKNTKDPHLRAILLDDFITREGTANKEFAALARQVIRLAKENFAADDQLA